MEPMYNFTQYIVLCLLFGILGEMTDVMVTCSCRKETL